MNHASDTESNSAVNQEYLQQKIENIKKAFASQDKNLDGDIDQYELLDFLDSNSKSGKYDRNLAKKIFSILDIDNNGKITIDEFIKSYVGIIDEVKSQIKELERNFQFEAKNKSKLELMVKQNIHEPLNDEELGPNSKFTIEIINIEYLERNLTYDGIFVKITFGNKKEVTKIISTNSQNLVWQQKFEFSVLRKDDIIFEIFNVDTTNPNNQISFGVVRFSLNLLERQEEYDVLLEVPDIENNNNVYAKINAKIQFIWSLHKYYNDEFVKSEERYNNIKSLINSKQNVLLNLNGNFFFDSLEPFEIFETYDKKLPKDNKSKNKFVVKQGQESIKNSDISKKGINEKLNNLNNDFQNNNPIYSNKPSFLENNLAVISPFENQVAENLENFLKDKLSN